MFFVSKLKRSVKVAIVLALLTIALGIQYINVADAVPVAGGGTLTGGGNADCICDDYNNNGKKW